MNEMRQMQRRILHLERINEALRKDLKYLRTCPDKKSAVEKTDVSLVAFMLTIRSQKREMLKYIFSFPKTGIGAVEETVLLLK